MDRKSRILISGAGIAGLAAAIRLSQNGFRPTIVEKAPSIRAYGFIISLSHHSYHLAESIGILDDVKAQNNRIKHSSYHDLSGRAILTLDYERLFDGLSIVQIMRDDLQTILYDHAQDCADYVFSNSIASIEQDASEAHVTFESGDQGTYDLVVGADGLHSRVREVAFAPEEIKEHFFDLHASAFRAKNYFDLEHKYEAYLEKKRHTIIYTTSANDLSAIFIYAAKDRTVPSGNAERLALLSKIYEGASDNVRQIIDGQDPDDRIYMDPLIQIEMENWYKGRVALTGDAAHSLTLLSGQGGSVAFASACALAEAVSELPFEAALPAYQAKMQPIVAKLQPTTRSNARWYVPGNLAFHMFRDLSMRLVPNEIWVRYFHSKYSKA